MPKSIMSIHAALKEWESGNHDREVSTIIPAKYADWMNSFLTPASELKLAFVGPKFYWIISGKFDPDNWPKFRGNAHQRRVKRRYYTRMWKKLESATRQVRGY